MIALALVCASSASLDAAESQTGNNSPVIRFLAPVYHFGTVLAGDPVEHVFEFTNSGNAPLKILGVYPSCSCTLPGVWTREVAPGQTGRVTLMLDTSRFDGPVGESTTVASTDGAHFNVALQFKGTVFKPIELNPRTVLLRPAFEAQSGCTNSTKIINHLPDPVTLERPVSDNPAFAADLKTIVPGMQYQLAVRTTQPRAKPVQGTISIKTSSSRVPFFVVPVLVMPQSAPSPGTPIGTNKAPAVGHFTVSPGSSGP